MTKEEKIQKIREWCIAANPDIVKLEFGCKYIVGKKHDFILRREAMQDGYCGQCREGGMSGAAFRDYRCGYCKKGFMHPNTAVPKYCVECANEHKKCRYCAVDLEIIGRDIRLADVLLAKSGIMVSSDGCFRHLNGYPQDWKGTKIFWNLRKDNLNEQDDPTIDFIYSLIPTV